MKAKHIFLIFSIFSFNSIFAEEKPNLDDPKVQDQIIAIAVKKLDVRTKWGGDRISYLPFRQVPYTGWTVMFYDNGQVKELSQYKDGKLRFKTYWYESGQKKAEENYKDGKEDGPWNKWYQDGREWVRHTYKDGKLVLD